MMAERGQVSIIYLVITLAIAFFIAAGVFLFARGFTTDVGASLGEVALSSVAQQLESVLLDLKRISDQTNETVASVEIQIPKTIGDQRYTIAGENSSEVRLRTLSEKSVLKILEVNFWDVEIVGFAESSQGFVKLTLNQSTVRIE